MHFDEALAAVAPTVRRSKLDRMLDDLTDAERTSVLAALNDHRISCQRIRLALSMIGVSVGRSTIERWRSDNPVR